MQRGRGEDQLQHNEQEQENGFNPQLSIKKRFTVRYVYKKQSVDTAVTTQKDE